MLERPVDHLIHRRFSKPNLPFIACFLSRESRCSGQFMVDVDSEAGLELGIHLVFLGFPFIDHIPVLFRAEF